MLRLGRSAAFEATSSGGIVTSALHSNLHVQLEHRGLKGLQCTYQTQSSCHSKPGVKRGHHSLSLAVAGAAALSAGCELHAEGVAQARATFEFESLALPTQPKWQLFDQIGAGAFGVVRLGMHEETGEVAAVKMVPLEPSNEKRSYMSLEREISALQLVKALGGHRNIIDLKDVYIEGRNVCIATELARGGELFEQIVAYGSLPEVKAQTMAREMASALSFLHRHGLVHKDVKPENILLTKRYASSDEECTKASCYESASFIKLADFGSAGPAGVTTDTEESGTAGYLPPELLMSGDCTSACDMWALGCVLYITLSGSHPFDLDGMATDSVVEHRVKTEAISFDFSAWHDVSVDAKDLVSKLLEKDPTLRLTADEMLQHPWMLAQVDTTSTIRSFWRPSPLIAGQSIPMTLAKTSLSVSMAFKM
ncbi:hypothetical protein CCR75_000753 [Bremia lactucae]|uniref:Protein kinase domain-containing protein n=1 Tax=Bremia lactucae TaxID=4779 RepID=A0A976NY77_BRELC|nr:hypothetical protein CCR75_000753 [Bremia lactucae]